MEILTGVVGLFRKNRFGGDFSMLMELTGPDPESVCIYDGIQDQMVGIQYSKPEIAYAVFRLYHKGQC
jgi:hypothetical protein